MKYYMKKDKEMYVVCMLYIYICVCMIKDMYESMREKWRK